MRIQNNIMAMNTHRFYTANNNAVSKSAEKLSSGYRVNRAGDDAAGLAISEKMRAEIRGLSMASKNSQDGVSMVQTAEGALTEVHSMLQRMKELAVQAASDSNENEIDRPALDAEFQQLIKEIDDVAKTTTFNDMKLLDGSFQEKVIQIGSRTGNEMDISIENMDAESLGLVAKDDTAAPTGGTIEVTSTAGVAFDDKGTEATDDDVAEVKGTITLTFADLAGATGDTADKFDDTATYSILGKDYTVSVAKDETIAAKDLATEIASQIGGTITIEDAVYDVTDNEDGTLTLTQQVGADTIDAAITALDASVELKASEGANLLTQDTASKAIDFCRDSINQVSTQRAKLGAIQNRLEHKISNLDNTVENVSAAEARIRDVDIAKEMTNFTKNQILSQAATAMLAQANSLPQNVLSLLQ